MPATRSLRCCNMIFPGELRPPGSSCESGGVEHKEHVRVCDYP